MFQNIKVDIIYHKSNTDFEMEFNLCGCCRMRLLTAKTPDKKVLVHSLARAVSRSRVIMIVGELFGKDSIVDIIAAATGSKTEIADNQKYGIDSNIDIKIISQSIPLVTPEGYFGGCIIEKGPQTMILLTDNKNVRKSVMRSLIHPYIEELCALDFKEKSPFVIEHQEVNNPPASEETEEEAKVELSEETQEVVEENPIQEDDAEELIIETEDEEAEEYYEDDIDLVTEDDYEEIEMESMDSQDDDFEVESDLLYEENTIDLKTFKKKNADYYYDDDQSLASAYLIQLFGSIHSKLKQ